LKEVSTLIEFQQIINEQKVAVFCVKTLWSGDSMARIPAFEKLSLSNKNTPFYIIPNGDSRDEGDSFIYGWLKEQEGKNWAGTNTQIPVTTRSWIHGYSETFMIINGELKWFENRTEKVHDKHFIDCNQ
jgi:hypothetical protein